MKPLVMPDEGIGSWTLFGAQVTNKSRESGHMLGLNVADHIGSLYRFKTTSFTQTDEPILYWLL